MDFAVFAVFLSMIATMPALDIFLPSLPGMAQYFAVNASSIKDTIVVFQIGSVLSALVLGFLSDHFGRKPLILLGLGLFIFGSVICSFTKIFSLFILGRFLEGAGGISIPVVGWAMIYDMYGERQSAKIMSMLGACFSIIPLISPTIGGYIDVSFGWQWNFVILAVLSTITLLLLIFKLEEPKVSSRYHPISWARYLASFGTVLRNRIFLTYVLIFASLIVGEWCYLTHIPFFLEKNIGMGPKECGLFIAIVSVSYLLGSLITAKLVDRYGLKETVSAGLKISFVGACLSFLSQFVDRGVHLVFGLAIGVFLFGLALIWSPSTTMSLQAVKERKGVASSVRSLLFVGATALGSYSARFFRDTSTIQVSFVILLCSFASLLLFSNRKNSLISDRH